MIRNLIERIWFMFSKIPIWQEAKQRIPEGRLTRYNMSDIPIASLEWKKDWIKKYEKEIDPPFRHGRPFAPTKSDPKNITQKEYLMQLTMPKQAYAKDAYIESNFTIKYGTVRALIKLPNVKSAWSAFWLMGRNGMPEHDILEHCGCWKNKVSVTQHWGFSYEKGKKKQTRNNARWNWNFKPTDEYYLYEVELNPYKVVYRINGIKVRTLRSHLSSGDNVVIFDVTKGNYCQSELKDELTKDATMIVDFLEIYEI